MTNDRAETVALKALGWLVGNEELLPVFLGASGADLDTVRTGAQDPAFLMSVLDFVLMDDAWVLELAQAAQIAPEEPFAARQVLAGPGAAHWT